MSKWLSLAYKIPREPSANRVYVWRKMKQLGAVLLQDAVWVLPESPRTREQFQWLAAEITELGGEASLWAADLIYATDEQALNAFMKLARLEGIIPALESAHAIAAIIERVPKMRKDQIVIANLSGRGDKDVAQVANLVKL